jgi:hypothetical protein
MNGGPVQPGERLQIRASTWNALLDMERRIATGEGAAPASPGRGQSDPTLIRVKNTSTTDLGRYGVCGLGDTLWMPTDNQAQFLEMVVLKAIAPASNMQLTFGVAVEPIAIDRIGRVQVEGSTPVKINVTDEANQWAICTANMTRLETRPYGTARILWKEAGTGERWGVVRLGLLSGPFRIQFPGAVAAGSSIACQYYVMGGTLSSQTVAIFNRSGGSIGTAGRVGYAYLNSQERELQFIQESCP